MYTQNTLHRNKRLREESLLSSFHENESVSLLATTREEDAHRLHGCTYRRIQAISRSAVSHADNHLRPSISTSFLSSNQFCVPTWMLFLSRERKPLLSSFSLSSSSLSLCFFLSSSLSSLFSACRSSCCPGISVECLCSSRGEGRSDEERERETTPVLDSRRGQRSVVEEAEEDGEGGSRRSLRTEESTESFCRTSPT